MLCKTDVLTQININGGKRYRTFFRALENEIHLFSEWGMVTFFTLIFPADTSAIIMVIS